MGFNQTDYIAKWRKENMRTINAIYKKSFVDEFKEACKILEVSQSQVFRKAMSDVIKKAAVKKTKAEENK